MPVFDQENDLTTAQQEQLLDELEVRCQTDVATLRENEPRRRHASIVVLAGNACERNGAIVTMQNSELGTLSASGLAPHPVMVGSVFLLQIDRDVLPTGSTLAVCDRCLMLGEGSFELRFRFPSPIELNEA